MIFLVRWWPKFSVFAEEIAVEADSEEEAISLAKEELEAEDVN